MVSFGRISPNRFLSSILLVVVIIVTVVIVVVILVVAIVEVVIVVVVFGVVVVVADGVSLIFKFLFMIIVTFPSMLRGRPPIKASKSFSLFGTMFGHKVPRVVRLACSIPIGWAYAFHQDKASSVKVPVANVTLFSSAHLLRENTDSVRSNQRIRPTAPSVPLKQKGKQVGASRAAVKSQSKLLDGIQIMVVFSECLTLLGGILLTKDNT
ncbi:hypothetical protein Tco_1484714 [Tanacetum coccineum]